jgi:hypothetical protein
MKPFRIFIFLLSVLLLLVLVALLFPGEGISLGGNHRLTFASLPELKGKDTTGISPVNVEKLLSASTVTEDPESEPEPKKEPEPKTVPVQKQAPQPDREPEPKQEKSIPKVIPANTDSLKLSVHRIELTDEGASLLQSWFRNLDRMSPGNNRNTRILHFGDSQIENDRMTALIRYRLQRQFGGTGIGLVQAVPLYSGSLSYQQEEHGDWLRYTYFGRRDSSVAHKSYGIMGAFASVPTPTNDRWPSLYYKFNTSRRGGQVQRIRLFLHSYVDSATVVFCVEDRYCDTISGIPDGFSVVNFFHVEDLNSVRISFNLPEGGRVYGISFESEDGLLMDNIAMRGGSGLIFTSMNLDVQQAMLDNLSPGLILLQYGGNVVPYMHPGYYRRAFKKQLQFFKELCPGTPVIVIGPSDMSVRVDGHFDTYPGLEAIRDALRDAAMESGFGFWDLYEAMGGYNSMPSFVQAVPSLASADYIHFNNLGINLVAEMFYNALMVEFNNYEFKTSGR